MSDTSGAVLLSNEDDLRAAVADCVGPAVDVIRAEEDAELDHLASSREPVAVIIDGRLPWSRIAAAAERLAPRLGGRPLVLIDRTPEGGLRTRLLTGLREGGSGVLSAPTVDVAAAIAAGRGAMPPGDAVPATGRSPSDFLSHMSHELRTPLNAILGFAQILEMDELTPDQRECVEHILRAGRVLLAMINEVLEISRLDTGRASFKVERVDMVSVLAQVADEAAPQAAARGIEVTVDTAEVARLEVRADLHRTRQVLHHLLGNAVSYNRMGGSVVLSCRAVAGARVRTEVRDSGPGIAEESLPRLFTPFERLEARASGVEGSGLGLTLCKRLVEAMGGTIGVKSALGRGSTFWFDLPGHGKGSSGSLRALRTPDEKPLSIVYIEDHSANVDLLRRALADRSDITLSHASTGRDGLDLMLDSPPDLLLLDLSLPDLPGEAVLKELRDVPSTASLPVVVISADATPARVERLNALGVREVLTKPLDIQRFFSVLETVLGDRVGPT